MTYIARTYLSDLLHALKVALVFAHGHIAVCIETYPATHIGLIRVSSSCVVCVEVWKPQ